jgi:hypothetical protein
MYLFAFLNHKIIKKRTKKGTRFSHTHTHNKEWLNRMPYIYIFFHIFLYTTEERKQK